ncbi:MAG: hypothetical protein ACI870_000544, partial [Crocinitomicaceae bacterium]
ERVLNHAREVMDHTVHLQADQKEPLERALAILLDLVVDKDKEVTIKSSLHIKKPLHRKGFCYVRIL